MHPQCCHLQDGDLAKQCQNTSTLMFIDQGDHPGEENYCCDEHLADMIPPSGNVIVARDFC